MERNQIVVTGLARMIMFAIGEIKRTKRSGPETEPWGTPVSMVVTGNDDESISTKGERENRYDRIQEMTKQDKPNVCSSL